MKKIIFLALLVSGTAFAETITVPEKTIEVPIPMQEVGCPSQFETIGEFIITAKSQIVQTQPQTMRYTVPSYTLEIPDSTPPNTTKLYAPNSVWNTKLGATNRHPNSAGFIAELRANLRTGSAWVNAVGYGVPLYFVDEKTPKIPVYKTTEPNSPVTAELLKGIRIPAKLTEASGTDGHAAIISLVPSEPEVGFWKLRRNATLNRWECQAAYIGGNGLTSDGTTQKMSGWWNSATAAHINLPAGIITKSDLDAGKIDHALVFAMSPSRVSRNFIYPARSSDGYGSGVNHMPMGTRLRFPSNITINPNWTPLTKMMVESVRDYGMVLRDTTHTAGNVALFGEDTTQFGISNPFGPHLNGKKLWDVVGTRNADGEFPWSQLEVVA